jgi:malonate transporter and related proteins
MTEILLDSLMPIFVVMALGYLAGWTRDIDNHHLAALNALVMDFALPLSLFVATASTPRALLLAQWPLLVLLVVSMLVLYALSFWAQRRWFGLGSSEASVQTLTTAVPNYAGGLPLFAAVFGPTDTIFVALALATASIVLSPLTLAILEFNNAAANGQQNFGVVLQAISRSLRKPIVLGPVAGVLFALLGIPLLEPVSRSFQLIGQSAGGVALFLTGLILSSQRVELNLDVSGGVLVKNIVHPLLAVGLILVLPIDRDTARAAVLLCALPSGFFGVLFGLRYGLESHVAGATLIASSIASILTLPAVLVLTGGW